MGPPDVVDAGGSNTRAPADLLAKQPGLVSFVLVSSWCGIVAGLFEVATIVIRKQLFDANHLYGMSRHFIWLIPTVYLCIFAVMGALGRFAVLIWPRYGRWLLARLLCAVFLLPIALIAFPRIYTLAWFVMSLGIATRIVPVLESHRRQFYRSIQFSFPVAVGLVLSLAALPWASDRIKLAGERARALPPLRSPNVLLIVLDTVAASHLDMYGYYRPTSTTLVEVAERGIQFDSARAPSSWTLPSHATMFTGRWLHELSVGWLSPLDESRPTLAEFLGQRGYATAGFIANTSYCASDSGLGRGFTQYRDFIFPGLTAIKTSVLGNRVLLGLAKVVSFLEDRPAFAWSQPYVQRLWRALVEDRKAAAGVNNELLDWLSQRPQPERPFFAFLNYSDAHTPYELPRGRVHRFGVARPDERQREVIKRWGDLDKIRIAPKDLPIAIDAYDDCVADLDEQIGRLLDRLGRRGVLADTWLIIASDHGESFGEHPGVFCHGTSLYQTELHVPLLIVPPGGLAIKKVVKETVSLRDLAATIVDVLNLENGSPFPGSSLARYWAPNSSTVAPTAEASAPALAEVVPGLAINVDSYGLPTKTSPLGAVNDGEWSYIRNEAERREELFHLRPDAREQRNLAADPGSRPMLQQMRQTLDALTGGPLVPQRFNR
jgi:arylsulfatase A-like enzyme